MTNSVQGINGTSNYNYMSDPMFLAALNSYNANGTSFGAAQSTAQQIQGAANTAQGNAGISQEQLLAQYAAAQQGQGTTQSSAYESIMAQQQPQEEESSSTGKKLLVVGGVLVAAATIGAFFLGKGKAEGIGGRLKEGFKTMLGWFKGKSTDVVKTATEESKAATEKLTAIVENDGVKFLNPEVLTTVEGEAAINSFAKAHNITVPTGEKLGLTAESALSEFTAGGYNVKLKDGQITEILDSGKTNVLPQWLNSGAEREKALIEGFSNIHAELGKEASAIDKTILDGVKDIGYVNKFGDDAFHIVQQTYGATPELKSLQTLERLTSSSPQMQSYILQAGEDAFTHPEFLNKRHLVDGLELGNYTEVVNGTKCYFNGKDLIAIDSADGIFCPKGSMRFNEWIKESTQRKVIGVPYSTTPNQEAVNNLIDRIFVKREYIPNGAIVRTKA